MTKNAADVLSDQLVEWGITTTYWFRGDGINGFLGPIQRSNGGLRFVQTRHEEMASFDAVTTPDETPASPPITYEQVKALTNSVVADRSGGIGGANEAMIETLHDVLASRH